MAFFTPLLSRKFLVGIGTNAKAAERAVRFATENLVQPGDQVILVNVNIVSPPETSEHRVKQVQRMVTKHLAPILNTCNVRYRVHTVHMTLPMFMSANPSYLVGHTLCTKARDMGASALVVGGSGKDNFALTLLIGHSISHTVAKFSTVPAVLVGPIKKKALPIQVPDLGKARFDMSTIPSLAQHDAIAAAA